MFTGEQLLLQISRDLVLNKLQNEMKFTPDFGFKITHVGELYERNNENR